MIRMRFDRSLLYAGRQIQCTIHRPEVTQVIRMRFDRSLFTCRESDPVYYTSTGSHASD